MQGEIKIEGQGKDKETKKEMKLKSVADFYRGFHEQFKLFESQILEGKFEKVDAWCDSLVRGDIPELHR